MSNNKFNYQSTAPKLNALPVSQPSAEYTHGNYPHPYRARAMARLLTWILRKIFERTKGWGKGLSWDTVGAVSLSKWKINAWGVRNL